MINEDFVFLKLKPDAPDELQHADGSIYARTFLRSDEPFKVPCAEWVGILERLGLFEISEPPRRAQKIVATASTPPVAGGDTGATVTSQSNKKE